MHPILRRLVAAYEKGIAPRPHGLDRRRRVLGEDHPDTLSSARSLAPDLSALGAYERARDLDEDSLTRYRRVLGEDHPATRRSERHLAMVLQKLWEATSS